MGIYHDIIEKTAGLKMLGDYKKFVNDHISDMNDGVGEMYEHKADLYTDAIEKVAISLTSLKSLIPLGKSLIKPTAVGAGVGALGGVARTAYQNSQTSNPNQKSSLLSGALKGATGGALTGALYTGGKSFSGALKGVKANTATIPSTVKTSGSIPTVKSATPQAKPSVPIKNSSKLEIPNFNRGKDMPPQLSRSTKAPGVIGQTRNEPPVFNGHKSMKPSREPFVLRDSITGPVKSKALKPVDLNSAEAKKLLDPKNGPIPDGFTKEQWVRGMLG